MPGFAASRRLMPYEEYLLLPPELRAEWVDGEVVLPPCPSDAHQQVSRRLVGVLEAALTGVSVVDAVPVTILTGHERIPDVAVVRHEPAAEARIGEVPLLVVDVLSADYPGQDIVGRSTEYFAAGVGQYWLVEPLEGTLEVYDRTAAGWARVVKLDQAQPTVTVTVAEAGAVQLDRATLFAL